MTKARLGRPPKDREAEKAKETESFLARMQATQLLEGDLDTLRNRYGHELPDDVVEVIARQQAAARPIVEQYHLLAEKTPSLLVAQEMCMAELDEIMDVVVGMDLTDMGDFGEFEDEYTCPRCAHRWSGAPNYRTGYGNVAFVPTGRVSSKTGRVQYNRYGTPRKTNRNFKYGRHWKGAGAAALPRGFGNRPIGEPIVADSWRKKARPPKEYE